MASDGEISLLRPGERGPGEAPIEEHEIGPPPSGGVKARNRRQKLLFVLGTIVLTVLIVGGIRYWAHSVRPLRIATGPIGTVEYRFAQQLMDVVAANSTALLLKLIPADNTAAATARFARGDADLGFVRTDQKVPGSARALALVEHFAFLLVIPKGGKIANLGDLRGKKV